MWSKLKKVIQSLHERKKKSSNIILILIHSRKTGIFLSPPVILTRELEHRVHYSILIYQTKGRASIDQLQLSPALLARPRMARSCGLLNKTSNTTCFPPQVDPGRVFLYSMQRKAHNCLRADSRQSSKTAFSKILFGYPTKSLSTT